MPLLPQLVSPEELRGALGDARVSDRGARLGLTCQVLRGAAPEVLGDIISQVRAAGPDGRFS